MDEKKTTSKKTVAVVSASWILTIISMVFALLKGGTASFEVPCNNGGKCLLMYDQSSGILDLLDDCRFKETGDKCKVAAAMTAVYEVAAPEGTPAEVKPVETPAEVKPVETPAEVKPVETPAEVKPVEAPAEVKPVETPAEVKPEEVKPAAEIKEEPKPEEKKE